MQCSITTKRGVGVVRFPNPLASCCMKSVTRIGVTQKTSPQAQIKQIVQKGQQGREGSEGVLKISPQVQLSSNTGHQKKEAKDPKHQQLFIADISHYRHYQL